MYSCFSLYSVEDPLYCTADQYKLCSSYIIYFDAISLYNFLQFHSITCWCFIIYCVAVSSYILLQFHYILCCSFFIYSVVSLYIFCSFITYFVAVSVCIVLPFHLIKDRQNNTNWNRNTIYYENATIYITKKQHKI